MDNTRSGSGAVKKRQGDLQGARHRERPEGTAPSRFAYLAFGIVMPGDKEGKRDNNFSGHVRLRLIKEVGEGPTGKARKAAPGRRPDRPAARTSGQGATSVSPGRGTITTPLTGRVEARGPRPVRTTGTGVLKKDPTTARQSVPARPLVPSGAKEAGAARPRPVRLAGPRVVKKDTTTARPTATAETRPGGMAADEAKREGTPATAAGPQATGTMTGEAPKATPKTSPKATQKTTPKAAQASKKDKAPAPSQSAPKCDLYAAPKISIGAIISYTLLAAVLAIGWLYRGEEIITAKEGAGYVMGIIGASMMLLLVLYPLRKTARFMRRMGPVKHWFRAHMVLGLVGPALILFHANFSMGSLNSSVALVAMILVALSGIVGRYIYAGIHYGLYGKEMSLNELRNDFKDRSHGMKYVLDYAPAIQERILAFDAMVLRPRYSFMGSLLGLTVIYLAVLRLRLALALALRRTLRVAAKRHKWTKDELKAHGRATRLYLSNHISAAMAIARFKVYERLFSLWHLLHLPLFLMLVLTAIIHVVAVHMF